MVTAAQRLKRTPSEQEVGTVIKLGSEFSDAQTLTASEAKVLIENQLTLRKDKLHMTDVLSKSQAYLDTFARFRSVPAVVSAESILNRPENNLHPYERAQLGTLCFEEAEEAKTLIPSLARKFDDQTLQALLNELTDLRKFQ